MTAVLPKISRNVCFSSFPLILLSLFFPRIRWFYRSRYGSWNHGPWTTLPTLPTSATTIGRREVGTLSTTEPIFSVWDADYTHHDTNSPLLVQWSSNTLRPNGRCFTAWTSNNSSTAGWRGRLWLCGSRTVIASNLTLWIWSSIWNSGEMKCHLKGTI